MVNFAQVLENIAQALDGSTSNAAILRRIKREFPVNTQDSHEALVTATPSNAILHSRHLCTVKKDAAMKADVQQEHLECEYASTSSQSLEFNCELDCDSDGDDDNNYNETFLDSLSNDELIRVANFLDPNHPIYCSVPIKRRPTSDILLFFNGAFRRVVPDLFHTLEMHECRHLTLLPLSGVIQMGRADETKGILLTLLLAGRCIRTILLRSCSPDQVFVTDISIYAKILAYLCPNVTRIICKGDDDNNTSKQTIEEIIYRFRKCITSLEIRAKNRFYDGSCGRTAFNRLLESSRKTVIPLRKFTYCGKAHDGHLAPLWKSIPLLEAVQLKLPASTDWAPTFDSLKTHCRKLHTIILENPLRASNNNSVREHDFVTFLCSYGKQLKKALVHSINPDHAKLLAAQCPNVRCTFVEKRNHFDRIVPLGKNIEDLSLRVKSEDDDAFREYYLTGYGTDDDSGNNDHNIPISAEWTDLAAAISACRSLTTLKINTKPVSTGTIYPISGACIDSIFRNNNSSLRNLEHLSMCVIAGWIPRKLIARATGRLKSVKIHFWYYSIPGFWLTMMQHNRQLENIDMGDRESRKEEDTAMFIDHVVGLALKLPNMKKLHFSGHLSHQPGDHFLKSIDTRLKHNEIHYGFLFKDSKQFIGHGFDP